MKPEKINELIASGKKQPASPRQWLKKNGFLAGDVVTSKSLDFPSSSIDKTIKIMQEYATEFAAHENRALTCQLFCIHLTDKIEKMSIVVLHNKPAVNVTVQNVKLGMRVRRGPDWAWRNQDSDEEGQHAGTIIRYNDDMLYKEDGSEVWVRVHWDRQGGGRWTYRIGKNEFDLIIDTSKPSE